MSTKRDQQTMTSVRLPESLVGRFDKIAESMSQPGIRRVTRAEVHRLAALRGVEQLEAEGRKKR